MGGKNKDYDSGYKDVNESDGKRSSGDWTDSSETERVNKDKAQDNNKRGDR